MRRVFAILLMLFVPLQFAWSAAQSLHGHPDSDVSVLSFHSHEGDSHHHGESEPSAHHETVTGGVGSGNSDAGHSDGHYHPIFVSVVVNAALKLGEPFPSGPPIRPLAAFISRVPPLFDWPPSARA